MGAESWINKEAVISLTGWSDRTIRWKVQLGALRLRNTSNEQKQECGSREYALSSLPVEAQLKFLKQPLLSGPACTALALRSDLNQSNLFASLPEVTEPERLNFSPRTERPGLEAPGSHCAARGIQQPQPAIASDVSYQSAESPCEA